MSSNIIPLIDRLVEAFPACFNRAAPKPLKIGVGPELLALVGVHPALMEVSRKQIRIALAFYTGASAYRKAVTKGGSRYGLDGQTAGEVTPEQQEFAKKSRKKPSSATTAPAAAESATDAATRLQEVIAMAIPAKLDVTIKLNQLPHVKPSSPKTMLFAVQAGNRTVLVEIKNKVWNTLKEAAERYPQWVAAITGQPGEALPDGGFKLDNPAMQVFEKKPKAGAETPPAVAPTAPAPTTAATSSPAAPSLSRPKLSLKDRTK